MNPFDRMAGKKDILNILFQSDVKLTPQAFIKEIKTRFSVSNFEAKKMLTQLIDEQELSYHYLYGATYVEQSFLKPVRVTKHIVLKPPAYKNPSGRDGMNTDKIDPERFEILIEPGISFGSGQHPTTRLCLSAIDFCFFETQMVMKKQHHAGADIGTGSGVLAMAMCLSGLPSCTAYEIDPVSINEAKKNVALNHLTEKVIVVQGHMKESKNRLSVIAANLRFPTLKGLSDMIYASLIKNGIAILSGVREWEKDAFVTFYRQRGFEPVWQQSVQKWAGFVLKKKV